MYLLAQNHNERVDIYVLHLCVEILLVILGQIEFSDCWFIFSENSVLCLELTIFVALTVF